MIAISPKAVICPVARPAMPSAGSGPQPRASPPASGIDRTEASSRRTEGVIMLPVPRITEVEA